MLKPKKPKGQAIEEHWDELCDDTHYLEELFDRLCSRSPERLAKGPIKYTANGSGWLRIVVEIERLLKARGKDEYKPVSDEDIFVTHQRRGVINVRARGWFLRQSIEPVLELMGFELIILSSDVSYPKANRLQYGEFHRVRLTDRCERCPQYLACVLERS